METQAARADTTSVLGVVKPAMEEKNDSHTHAGGCDTGGGALTKLAEDEVYAQSLSEHRQQSIDDT